MDRGNRGRYDPVKGPVCDVIPYNLAVLLDFLLFPRGSSIKVKIAHIQYKG